MSVYLPGDGRQKIRRGEKTEEISIYSSFSCAESEFKSLIADYCGEKILENIRKKDYIFKTEGIWNDSGINPTYEYRVLIELLHLAYMKGGLD